MAKLETFSYFPSSIVIDEVAIDLQIKRMTNTEFDAFATRFAETSGERPGMAPESDEDAKARDGERRDWIKEALRENVRVLPGQMKHDGQDVAELGADRLLDIYGGRRDVVPELLGIIYGENRVSEKKKESYRLRLASQIGSLPERRLMAPGAAPVPTAASAVPKASAPLAPVTDSPASASCGTTGP